MKYNEFIDNKIKHHEACGISKGYKLNKILKDFQNASIKWNLNKGKSALWADCGLGKTFMQLEWARVVSDFTKQPVIVFAPLAVSQQTVNEGKKLGIDVTKCLNQDDVKDGVNITNYEKLHNFNFTKFSGIVIDESSILKSFTGKFRNEIIEFTKHIPFKLACTATPSPNDFMEIGNHAEFLGIMSRSEMLAMYFTHDSGDTAKWRLKGHAKDTFWKWVSSWALMYRKPSDIGFSDEGYDLPELIIHEVIIESDIDSSSLMQTNALSLQEKQKARRDSINIRVEKTAHLASTIPDSLIVWCELNNESEALKKSIPSSVEVKGSDSIENKEDRLIGFSEGKYQTIITKSSIAGFGMNWQHCHNMIFCGISDSFEKFYQGIRRAWRFGQGEDVHVWLVISDKEHSILENIKRKQSDAERMVNEMVSHNGIEDNSKNVSTKEDYNESVITDEKYTIYNADCVEQLKKLDSNSIGFSVFSPPFLSLYTYSNSNRDMGNSVNDDEFYKHFQFGIKELFRVLKPGRLIAIHCCDVPAMKERDGYLGLKDFPGELLRNFQKEGFIYHSRCIIPKNPLLEAVRTKAIGLLHKQLLKDSSISRQGIPDYMIVVRKPGNNEEPITHKDGFERYIGDESKKPNAGGVKFSHEVWRRYASNVWEDIRQSYTLNVKMAREDKDERHICPLQLDVIERCIELWSNPGDTILSPFAGIGSEGYMAIQNDRKFIGIELKKSYFDVMKDNLKIASHEVKQGSLFD